jgi:hypothetical protein
MIGLHALGTTVIANRGRESDSPGHFPVKVPLVLIEIDRPGLDSEPFKLEVQAQDR